MTDVAGPPESHNWQRRVFYALCAPGLVQGVVAVLFWAQLVTGFPWIPSAAAVVVAAFFITYAVAPYTTPIAIALFLAWRRSALRRSTRAGLAIAVCIAALVLSVWTVR